MLIVIDVLLPGDSLSLIVTGVARNAPKKIIICYLPPASAYARRKTPAIN
jgi:hypothetical protein